MSREGYPIEGRLGSTVWWVLVYLSQVTERTPVATRQGTCPIAQGGQQRLLPETHLSTELPAQLPDASSLC